MKQNAYKRAGPEAYQSKDCALSARLNPIVMALLALPVVGLTQAQTLDEVVVSATRSEQKTFDAPGAIQAVGAEVIKEAGPQINLSESLSRVPGVVVLNRQNYAQDLQIGRAHV